MNLDFTDFQIGDKTFAPVALKKHPCFCYEISTHKLRNCYHVCKSIPILHEYYKNILDFEELDPKYINIMRQYDPNTKDVSTMGAQLPAVVTRFEMDYFNKLRSTVTHVAAQVSNALPGNPLTREYDVGEQVATAGQGLYWRVFKASKKTNKQPVAVWLFDKKDIDRWPRDDKEMFINVIKKGVSQLTRLRHPRLLIIEHSIEESRDSLAFATEPVFAGLANCLGRTDFLPLPLPPQLTDFKLLEVEIKHGLLQIGEALAFLHIDASILHRNICPESIIINDKGAWKLGGFDFSVQSMSSNSQEKSAENSYDKLEWSERIPSVCQPSLDYLAPEYIMGGSQDPYSDMYSLGALAFAVFNKCKPPLEHKNALDRFKKNMEKLKSFPQQFVEHIPQVFRDDFKMCLNFTPGLRPDATQFTRIAYFDDPLVKALNYFESLMQMDNQQKMQFFKSLPSVLERFEKRPLLQKVMPFLAGEFATPDLIPFILPSVFLIAQQSDKKQFTEDILPHLVPVFSMQRPYQIALLLLQQMSLFLEKAQEEDVKRYVLPLIYNSITSETTRIQELCLSIVPTIGSLVDRNSMKTQLLPKLLKLATEGNVLAVRVQTLVSLGKLLPTLESWMVAEQVLPTLPKINSKEPGVLMAILGIYKLTFESEKVSVSREQWAKSALPFLVATSVENTLNLGQFEQFVAMIKAILTKVENEQRSRLQQLSAGQEDQRSVPNFDDVMKSSSTSTGDMKGLNDLSGLSGLGGAEPTTNGRSTGSGGALSLDEKKRLAAEQDMSRKTKTGQPILENKVSMGQIMSNSQSTGNISGFGSFSATTSKPVGNSSADPFGALFDPLAPSTSVQTTKGTIDLTDFMPSSNSATNTGNMRISPNLQSQSSTSTGMPFLPTSAGAFAHSGSALDTQVSNMTFGSTPNAFPQPPRSSNRPVSAGTMSSLDTLLSFSSQKQGPGAGNGFAIAPPPSAGQPVQRRTPMNAGGQVTKDPFSDLLG